MRAKSSGGDHGTDDHDDPTGDQQRSPTDPFTVHEGENGPEETAQFVAGSHCTTEDRDMLRVSRGVRGIIFWGNVEGREFLGELVSGNNTGHQPLIITKERESQNGGDGNRDMELPAPQARGCRPHLDDGILVGVRQDKYQDNGKKRKPGATLPGGDTTTFVSMRDSAKRDKVFTDNG